MTDQTKAAQPMLTDAEILALEVEAGGTFAQGPVPFARAIESALLSKLRAAVADERAAGGQYHLLKTDPEVFQAVLSGAKTFEIRLNDRGYAVGDVLGLRETKHTGAEMRAGAPLVYTGRECQRFVSHVLTGYGLAEGWCCLSFKLPHAGGASAPVAGQQVGALDGANRPETRTSIESKGGALAPVAGQVVAWMHEEDRNRVISAQQKAQAERDGGAYASSLRPYTIPLSRAAAPQASEAVRDAALEEAASLLDGKWATWLVDRAAYEIRKLKSTAAQPCAQKGSAQPSQDGGGHG